MDEEIIKQLGRKIRSEVAKQNKSLKENWQKDEVYRTLLAEKVFKNTEPLGELTGWSVAPEMSWWLYNEIVLNKYQNVVEFGSGFSTLVMAEAVKLNEGRKLISFEHDYVFYTNTKSMLERFGLADYVHLIYAPLTDIELEGQSVVWYDITVELLDSLVFSEGIDFLLIDGPPGSTQRHARYPAYPMLIPYLHNKSVIVLDDADRVAEREILQRWLGDTPECYDLKFINNIRHSPAVFTHKNSTSCGYAKATLSATLPDKLPGINAKFDELIKTTDVKGVSVETIESSFKPFINDIAVSMNNLKNQLKKSLVENEKKASELTELKCQNRKLGTEIESLRYEKKLRKEELQAVKCKIREMEKKLIDSEGERGGVVLLKNENQKKLDKPDIEIGNLVNELKIAQLENKEIKTRLSFFVGSAFARNLGSLSGWCKMPFDIYRSAVKYKQNKNKRDSIIMLLKSSKSKPSIGMEKKKNKQHDLLWHASNLYYSEGAIAACKYIKERAVTNQELIGADLIEANANLDNDNIWLEAANKYLNQFGLSPVALDKTRGESRFSQLTAVVNNYVHDGPKITVIMPAFNAEKTLRTSVASILDQTWSNLELIIVDDCSTDNTLLICQELQEKDGRIKVIRNEANMGPYVSKNLALGISTGEYITGHDADDWAHPERLETQYKEMVGGDGDFKVSISYMVRIREDGFFSHFSRKGKSSPDGVTRLASISCMYERKFLDKYLGYWDCVRFGADSEMIERAKQIAGDKFKVIRSVGMFCLDLDTSLTNSAEYGICKKNGISEPRKKYRDSWECWHQKIDMESSYLPFPHLNRKFEAPEQARVKESLLENIIVRSRVNNHPLGK